MNKNPTPAVPRTPANASNSKNGANNSISQNDAKSRENTATEPKRK